MNLNKIKDNIYYIDGAVNVGVIVKECEALLIDAALDESTARKIRRLLEESGIRLKGIIITHAHADHFGGAAYLVKSTGAKVYSTRGEKSILEMPILEPVYLFGGAYPPAALRSKFFYAPGVAVDSVITPGKANIMGFDVEIVSLKGHSLDQAGVLVQGVLFCADAVFASEVLQKHGIPLNADIQSTLDTYQWLASCKYDFYLPSHGDLTKNITPIVAANQRIVEAVSDAVLTAAQSPCTIDDIIAAACTHAGYIINNTGSYYLTHLTVMAYISYLVDQNKLKTAYTDNRQFFLPG